MDPYKKNNWGMHLKIQLCHFCHFVILSFLSKSATLIFTSQRSSKIVKNRRTSLMDDPLSCVFPILIVLGFLDKSWVKSLFGLQYSPGIVKDSNADSRGIFKFPQNPPIIEAVCTISKIIFAYVAIFLYFWEKIRRYHFCFFEYLS